MSISDIIAKSLDDELLSAEEIATLFELPLFSPDWGLLMAGAYAKSAKASGGKGEVHGQVGLNLAPCPRNCQFCGFAACNGIFTDSVELSIAEVLRRARQFESDGANAIFFMTTAQYPMEKFIELSQDVRQQLRPETVMIANVGDFTLKQAHELKDAGYAGIYHAIRMGEGVVTELAPADRLQTLRNCHEAGLKLGTCVEPVGPEHTTAELVEKTLITRDANPAYSGAARRIDIPGSALSQYGMISEARMAQIVAAVRLALSYAVPGNCTHEPCVIGAAGGANLLWAEAGANPRDTVEDTEAQRGMTVAECRKIMEEAEWSVLEGPSVFYGSEA